MQVRNVDARVQVKRRLFVIRGPNLESNQSVTGILQRSRREILVAKKRKKWLTPHLRTFEPKTGMHLLRAFLKDRNLEMQVILATSGTAPT